MSDYTECPYCESEIEKDQDRNLHVNKYWHRGCLEIYLQEQKTLKESDLLTDKEILTILAITEA
jgi:hypothetical protein